MLKKHRYVTAITAIALLLLNACDDGGPCHPPAPVAMPTEITWNGTAFGKKQLYFKTFSEFFAEKGIPEKADYYLIRGEDLINQGNQPLPKGRYLVWYSQPQEDYPITVPHTYVDPNKIFYVYTNEAFSWFMVSPYQLKTSIEEYDTDFAWDWVQDDSIWGYYPDASSIENDCPIEVMMEMEILNIYGE